MFSSRSKTTANFGKVETAQEKANFNNIRHALFSIAKSAKQSIKKRRGPSEPGEPPHTRGRGGHNLRGAIFVAADKESGVAGPRHSIVGEAGAAHEHGETYKGTEFEERQFMEPQLEAALPRIAGRWQGTIGE